MSDVSTFRFYDLDPNPISGKPVGDDGAKDIRLTVYERSVAVWTELSGIRFKILALLPAVSGAVVVALIMDAEPSDLKREAMKLALAVFGLAVTFALRQYDRCNSQHYDDLISRSRRAEHELGVHTGVFLGRKTSTDPLVQHDRALTAIYSGSLALWLAVVLLIGVWIVAP